MQTVTQSSAGVATLSAAAASAKDGRLTGATLSELTARFELLPAEHPAVKYVNERMRLIAPDNPPEVFVLGRRGMGVNAMALDSCDIVITPELLKFIQNRDELDGVLAHELAHIRGAHTEASESSVEAMVGRRRLHEYEADAWAFRRLCDSTLESNPRGLQTLLNRMDGGTAAWDLDHGRSIDRVQALLALEANLELDQDRAPLATALLRAITLLPLEFQPSVAQLPSGDNRLQLERAFESGNADVAIKLLESKPIDLSLNCIAGYLKTITKAGNNKSHANSQRTLKLQSRIELINQSVLRRLDKEPEAMAAQFETICDFAFSKTAVNNSELNNVRFLSLLRRQATKLATAEMQLSEGGILRKLSHQSRYDLLHYILDKTDLFLDSEGSLKVSAALQVADRLFPKRSEVASNLRAKLVIAIVSIGHISESKFDNVALADLKSIIKGCDLKWLDLYRWEVKDPENKVAITQIFSQIGVRFARDWAKTSARPESIRFEKFDLAERIMTDQLYELLWQELAEVAPSPEESISAIATHCFSDPLEKAFAEMWLGSRWDGKLVPGAGLNLAFAKHLARLVEIYQQAEKTDPSFASFLTSRISEIFAGKSSSLSAPRGELSTPVLSDFLRIFPISSLRGDLPNFSSRDVGIWLTRAGTGHADDLVNLYYHSFLLNDVASAQRLQRFATSELAKKLTFEEFSDSVVRIAIRQGALSPAIIRHLDSLIATPAQQAQAREILGAAWSDSATSRVAGIGVLTEGAGALGTIEAKDRGELLVTILQSQQDESRLVKLITSAWWLRFGEALTKDLLSTPHEEFFRATPNFSYESTLSNPERIDYDDPKTDGPEFTYFVSARECVDRLYRITDLERVGLIREILVGQDGLLMSPTGRKELAEILLDFTVTDADSESALVVRDCVHSLINNSSPELLTFTISELLASRALRPPAVLTRLKPDKEQMYKLASSFPGVVSKRFTEPLLIKSHLLERADCLAVVRERLAAAKTELIEKDARESDSKHETKLFLAFLFRGVPSKQVDLMVELVCEQLGVATDDPVSTIELEKLERITRNAQILRTNLETYLGQILNGAQDTDSMLAELDSKLPVPSGTVHHKMEPLELAVEVCRNIGPIGVRFLQLLGQVMPDLSDEEQVRLRSVYESNQQQLRGAAIETIRLIAPERVDSLREIEANVGGGALFSVYKANWDGSRVALRIMRPNSASICERTFETLDRVVQDLCDRSDKYEIAKPILGLVREWILAELSDSSFAEDDAQFREKWNGARDLFFQEWSIKVPDSQNELAPKIMNDEFVEGQNLSSIGEWPPARRKAAVATLARLYAQQIQDGLVHSDVSIGNYRVTDQNQLVVLDRNMYLKLSAHDQAEISSLLSNCMAFEATAEERSAAVRKFLTYLGAPSEAQEQAAAILSDLGSMKDEQSLLKSLSLVQSAEWMMPLRFQLLVKNISAINQLAQSAGFGGFADALMCGPGN